MSLNRTAPQDQRVAVVTGAAGGIGSAVTRNLLEAGYRVAAVDRDADQLDQLLALLEKDGLTALGLTADVCDEHGAESALEDAERSLGPVNALVNVAGVLRLGAVADFDDADWRTVFDVNVRGVFLMSRAAVRRMLPRGAGAVVTVASNAGHTPRAGMAAYAASKAAAEMFTKSLGLEVAGRGIRCNVVAPGSTDTAMLAGMWHDEQARRRTIDGDLSTYKAGIPLRKIARPQDVAAAVGFLLSDEASHITLETLTVDGGATLGA